MISFLGLFSGMSSLFANRFFWMMGNSLFKIEDIALIVNGQNRTLICL
jgi:hypothetical protein